MTIHRRERIIMSKPKSVEVYDLVLKKNFTLNLKNSHEYGIAERPFYSLKGERQFQIYDRFILPKNKHRLFVVVDEDTLEEFHCATIETFFLLCRYIKNEPSARKNIGNLKRKKIYKTKIQGRTFTLKNGRTLKILEKNDIVLYDIFENKEVILTRGNILSMCEEMGFDHTQIYDLGKGRDKTIRNRYILSEFKSEIFILVNVNTGKEYSCINNKSLFIQLNKPCTANETKYIYALKAGRQKTAKIGNEIFKLKGTTLNGTSNMFLEKKIREKIKREKMIRHKIAKNLRSRVREALLSDRAIKTDKTLSLTGCSIKFLVSHLASQFKTGMTWENYGYGMDKWNVDHIKCCNSFDLTKEDQQKECFHYSNLQPMWQTENFSKNDKTPEEWEEYKRKKRI